MSELDKVYKEYNKLASLSLGELVRWRNNTCSKKASLSVAPLNRNIRLKRKNKSEWDSRDIKDAKRSINFIKRMSKVKSGKKVKGCNLSRRDISLRNWAVKV